MLGTVLSISHASPNPHNDDAHFTDKETEVQRPVVLSDLVSKWQSISNSNKSGFRATMTS